MSYTDDQQVLLDKIRQAGRLGRLINHIRVADLADLDSLVRTRDVVVVFGRAYANDPRLLDAA